MIYYLAIIDLLLLARAWVFAGQQPPTLKRAMVAATANVLILGAMFPTSRQLLLSSAIIWIGLMGPVLLERTLRSLGSQPNRFAARFSVMGLTLMLLALGSTAPAARSFLASTLSFCESHLLIGPNMQHVRGQRILAWTAGVLLATGEANSLLGLLMILLDIHPKAATGDLREYKKGGLIGAVERILIMIFVVNNQFNAVGFILAAKGLVRFHDTANHEDAEYVLVGTLLSTLIAIAVGLLVPHLSA